jgi:RNA polymerase sigma factor (sigma-70 family)
MTPPEDWPQFLAMKEAEAHETYRLLMDSDNRWLVKWEDYRAATRTIAARLWERMQARERKKARRTVPLDSLLEEPAAPDDHVRDLANRDLIYQLIRTLTEQQALVVRLALENGLSHRDIAGLLGTSEKSSQSALRDAKKALRAQNPGTFPEFA